MTEIPTFFSISVFIAGLLSFFAPCILPLLPVYVARLSSSSDGAIPDAMQPGKRRFHIHWRLMLQTLIFVTGLATTFVLMGFGAGTLGGLLSSRIFLWIGGGLVILLGLHQTGLFHLLFLEKEKRLAPGSKTGMLGSYLLGFTFSFGWTPCVGPVLAAVLVLSSNGNQALIGAGLMLVYTLGLAIPFLLLSLFTDYLLKAFRKVSRFLPAIRIAGGVLIIAMGVLLMTDNLNLVTSALTGSQKPLATAAAKPIEAKAEPTTMPVADGVTFEKDFTLPDLSGNKVTLSEFAGKKVYIKFWATWCPICLAGLDEFITFSESKAASTDIAVLSIVSPGSHGEKAADDFKAWFVGQGYDFPLLLDQDGTIARKFNVRGYPTSVFIDEDGKVVESRTGHVQNADIDAILGTMP
jgi:cytochrome c biogenesis protein CcdA/thiol-disulfide isomerase/thioredoxin